MPAKPSRLMMLDSGAYTAWTQDKVIDVGDYITYCRTHIDCSHFINLDVIAGTKHGRPSLADTNAAADVSWSNYLSMCRELPAAKVIPVYHYGEDLRKLDRILSHGCPYIALGGSAHKSTGLRVKWLQSLRRYLFDGAGRSLVKLHGLALTSYDLMKLWEWESVDSTSWKAFATWGAIYLPIERGGGFDYTVSPMIVFTTPQSKKRDRQQHYETMSPMLKERMQRWLASCGVGLGTSVNSQKEVGYKLDVPGGEIWLDKKRRIMMRPDGGGKGVTNSFEMRALVNAKLVGRSNKVLPIRHMYFAGQLVPYHYMEFGFRRRLLSYYYTAQTPSATAYLAEHLRRLREGI